MKFYEYVYRDSFVHRLDPRVKLAWLFVFSSAVFLTSQPWAVTAIFLSCIAVGLLAKLPQGQIWDSIKLFVILMPLSYIVLYLFLIGIKWQAVFEALVFSEKFLLLILASIIFTMTTSARDMLLSLVKIKVPYTFAFMLTIAIRFIPLIFKETNNVINAQRARAHEFVFSLLRPVDTVKSFVPVIIPVFTLLLKRAYELSLSIDARGFGSQKKITYPDRLKFGADEILASVAMAGFLFFALKML
ncbi:MAG: energy-coupling factor transporter transmembrane protein EcfT [Candidatus Pacebacteria bacterium]|jgi:energy-coupling factor transport system permease protein|nr:energy-coupling factor transporter transmembrane protein EcfT [Candidatus Paceibacterota bacterium]